MEERSLRISGANGTLFNRLSNTLTKIINPTKEGINSMFITMKRNNMLKAYEAYNKAEDEETAEKKYEEAYTAYLEMLDKYILNSIYKKANAGTATDFQKKALSQYYGIVQLKENEFIEYKYRKQKYLLELDNENVRLLNKEKATARYKKFYISKMDELYKRILKNYSIKLADNTSQYDSTKEFIYTKVFITLEEYIRNILVLKTKNKENKQYEDAVESYQKFERFIVGKLDTRDTIEKNMVLLEISRKLFTHSLPLVVAELSYEKLLEQLDPSGAVTETKNYYRARVKLKGSNTVYTVAKIERDNGLQVCGYRICDIVYPYDLIGSPGETITSILDKLVKMLGNFEYFYDVDGHFVFQRKRTYLDVNYNNIIGEHDINREI